MTRFTDRQCRSDYLWYRWHGTVRKQPKLFYCLLCYGRVVCPRNDGRMKRSFECERGDRVVGD